MAVQGNRIEPTILMQTEGGKKEITWILHDNVEPQNQRTLRLPYPR